MPETPETSFETHLSEATQNLYLTGYARATCGQNTIPSLLTLIGGGIIYILPPVLESTIPQYTFENLLNILRRRLTLSCSGRSVSSSPIILRKLYFLAVPNIVKQLVLSLFMCTLFETLYRNNKCGFYWLNVVDYFFSSSGAFYHVDRKSSAVPSN